MAVTSVRLTVDRRTYAIYQRAWANLATPRDVEVWPVGVLPTPLPPASVSLTGLDLLLMVGRACSRLERRDDPSRLFALLKYGTAIAGGSDLRLADDQKELDSHKKKVLSDEFGSGMAMLVAERTYGRARWLDFETAQRQGLVRTKAPRSPRPDFGGLRRGGGGVVILEAKGTQSSHSYCRGRQIPSGCGQVATARLAGRWGGVTATRLVVGLSLRHERDAGGSRVYVGDPEEEKGYDFDFTLPPVEAVTRSHFVRIAALTGDSRLEAALTDREAHVSDGDSALELRSIGRDEYWGSRLTIGHASEELTMFVGLEAKTRESLLQGKSEPDMDAPTIEPISDTERGSHTVSRCEDGTVIELIAE